MKALRIQLLHCKLWTNSSLESPKQCAYWVSSEKLGETLFKGSTARALVLVRDILMPPRRLVWKSSNGPHRVEPLLDHLTVQPVDVRLCQVAYSSRHAGAVLDEQPDPG